jgi:hypothetical protein
MNIDSEQIHLKQAVTTANNSRRAPLARSNMSLALVQECAAGRSALESGISKKFSKAYDAELTEFLPNLLSLSASGELGAVVGVREAAIGELFLEQYLDSPVEQSVAGVFRTPVDRSQIVEIGNLAAYVPGLAYTLFAVLATVLDQAGFRWVVCTATPQVAAMLAKMSFSSQAICDADPARLKNGAGAWGEYYASRPTVIAGDISSAAAKVYENRDMAALILQFAEPIARMVADLRKASS